MVSMKSFKKAVIGTLLVAASTFSQAQSPLWCAGKLMHYFVSGTGHVYVFPDWRQDWIVLCSVSTAVNGVDPQACRGILSTVIAATTGRITTTIHFPSASNCASVPTYGAAPPIWYVMLNNP
jgi:hypothetical protein